MKYKLAIFDFDGTVASSLNGIHACMNDTLAAFGHAQATVEEVRVTIGLTLEESVRVLTKRRVPEAQIPAMVKLYRELHDSAAVPRVTLFDGVLNLLEELPSRGVKSALVSNKGKKGLAELLGRLKIWPFFDLTLSAEDVRYNKPSPELYTKHIAPQFAGISKSETVVIGDTDVDIRFAKAAGLASCWASYGYGDAGKCRKLGPDFEIGDPGALKDILRGNADGKSDSRTV